MAVHMDGRVGVLKDFIAETPIDIVEALHPPPMGDLLIGEALSAWKDKVVWASFPASITILGPEEVKKHALKLLRDAGSGDRLAIVFREKTIPNTELIMLAQVFENADLPLTMEKIDRIERSLT